LFLVSLQVQYKICCFISIWQPPHCADFLDDFIPVGNKAGKCSVLSSVECLCQSLLPTCVCIWLKSFKAELESVTKVRSLKFVGFLFIKFWALIIAFNSAVKMDMPFGNLVDICRGFLGITGVEAIVLPFRKPSKNVCVRKYR